MNPTKIEWTDRVWNPSKGCSKISEGCKNCYAASFAKRLQAMGMEDYKDGFKFQILPHRLDEPLKIKKPQRFFVNSMSDLFHEDMPDEYLDQIFDIIKKTPQHTYQILTKRAENMFEYFQNHNVPDNVWLGVTVENSSYTYRIDILRKIKSTIQFVSFEPLIGPIDKIDFKNIDWVIVGGESGNRARLIKPEWVNNIYLQCKKQNIPFFFKQWGTWGADGVKRNKKANGRLFKNKEWLEYPVVRT
ncbi:MAG: phage Gp37/Gp68 family protein [Bacteroidales bacterium]|nr:phage Gp37/Gp68 family protein [Bacteroidales bacterium]